MANLCYNEIMLIGEPEKLRHVLDTCVNMAPDKEGRYALAELQGQLGFVCDGWGRDYDEALGYGQPNVYTALIDEGVLSISSVTAWGDTPLYWDALCESEGLTGWAACSDVDGEYWITNDPECIWFPDCYIYDSYGESDSANMFGEDVEMEWFQSKQLLTDYLNEHSGLIHDYEEWYRIIEDAEGNLGRIIPIERRGMQVSRWTGKERYEEN